MRSLFSVRCSFASFWAGQSLTSLAATPPVAILLNGTAYASRNGPARSVVSVNGSEITAPWTTILVGRVRSREAVRRPLTVHDGATKRKESNTGRTENFSDAIDDLNCRGEINFGICRGPAAVPLSCALSLLVVIGATQSLAQSVLEFRDQTTNATIKTSVPTDRAFAFEPGDLGIGPGHPMTVTFTASSFPPSQQTVVYDLSYGFGPFDPGGDQSVSDVVAGRWPCSLTHFVSLQGLAGRQVAASDVTVDHVVRYDDGICRVTVPWAPVFQTSQARLLADVRKAVDDAIPDPFRADIDYFVVMQPHFRSEGSNVQGGFLTEGLFNVNVGPLSGQVSVNPAYNLSIRSDGLLQVDVLDRAVVATGFAEFAPGVKDNANTNIQCAAMNIENSVNSAFTQQVSQLFPNLAGQPSTNLLPARPSA